jgi:2-methylisocitrate lyase-like PEP mutase family enzyme
MTGYGTSLSPRGLPDAGLATMTEMHPNARSVANAVGVPVTPPPTMARATPSP